MTFITNQDGVVFEKDLGEDTANAITQFKPAGWARSAQ